MYSPQRLHPISYVLSIIEAVKSNFLLLSYLYCFNSIALILQIGPIINGQVLSHYRLLSFLLTGRLKSIAHATGLKAIILS